jgi:hypothetical protein
MVGSLLKYGMMWNDFLENIIYILNRVFSRKKRGVRTPLFPVVTAFFKYDGDEFRVTKNAADGKLLPFHPFKHIFNSVFNVSPLDYFRK